MNRTLPALAALPLTACGGGKSDSGATKQTSRSTSSPTSTSSQLPLGGSFAGPNSSVTVSQFVSKSRSETNGVVTEGNELVTGHAKTCLKDSGRISIARWKLVDTDSGEYSPNTLSGAADGYPQPRYPDDEESAPVRAAGSCASGWIYFEVADKATPERVEYLLGNDINKLSPHAWKLR